MADSTTQKAWEEVERHKYEIIWGVERYHAHSPGERIASTVMDTFHMKHGDTLTDFGCGAGRAMSFFTQHGLKCQGVDLVHFPHLDNVVAPLWDLPLDLPRTDWGFCCDVMEHIPPVLVADVLHQISHVALRGIYLGIAHFEDNAHHWTPVLKGQQLHLTVKPPGWWAGMIAAHMPSWTVAQTHTDSGPDRSHWFLLRGD